MDSGSDQEVIELKKPRFWLSNLGLALGWLTFLSNLANIAQRVTNSGAGPAEPSGNGVLPYLLIPGILAYKSAKRRAWGLRTNKWYRLGLEVLVIGFIYYRSATVAKFRLTEDPLTFLLTPVWIITAYVCVQIDGKGLLGTRIEEQACEKEESKPRRKRSRKTFAILTSLTAWSVIVAIYMWPDKSVVKTQEDWDYLVQEVLSGGKESGVPKSHFQQVFAEFIDDLTELNAKSDEKIESIGPITFDSFLEMKDPDTVLTLREKTQQYWTERLEYYDAVSLLVGKSRKLLGYDGPDLSEHYKTQKVLEKEFVRSLLIFYEFLSEHHQNIEFTEAQIYLATDELVSEFQELAEAFDKSSTLLSAHIEEHSKKQKKMLEYLETER